MTLINDPAQQERARRPYPDHGTAEHTAAQYQRRGRQRRPPQGPQAPLRQHQDDELYRKDGQGGQDGPKNRYGRDQEQQLGHRHGDSPSFFRFILRRPAPARLPASAAHSTMPQ